MIVIVPENGSKLKGYFQLASFNTKASQVYFTTTDTRKELKGCLVLKHGSLTCLVNAFLIPGTK
jgi:hypothetical protein